VPVIIREVSLLSAARPPIAARCFSTISSAVCAAAAWTDPSSTLVTATNRNNFVTCSSPFLGVPRALQSPAPWHL
jgi:hypothetical protein